MILLDTPTGQRLRPIHMLLMLYRYLSGIYQLGDISALNYLKGYRDAGSGEVSRILAIAGHGIGEPELWLADRYPHAEVDSLSFRLLDTQLAQFLRTAGPAGVRQVFGDFRHILERFPQLNELFADVGLAPYWEQQADEWSTSGRENIRVYSNSPQELPAGREYQVIYVSHSEAYLDQPVIRGLSSHLAVGGTLALLLSTHGAAARLRFAESDLVQHARERLNSWLRERGYPSVRDDSRTLDRVSGAERIEPVRFTVPAPAKAVVVGELLLYSMHEHLSDHVRLEMLDATLAGLSVANEPVREVLQLFVVQGRKGDV